MHIMTRNAQYQLGVATQGENWNGDIMWEKWAVEELEQVRKYLRKGNGRNIRQEDGPEVKFETKETSYRRVKGQ